MQAGDKLRQCIFLQTYPEAPNDIEWPLMSPPTFVIFIFITPVSVVYFDQLLGAARTRMLVKLLFSAVFNLFCSFSGPPMCATILYPPVEIFLEQILAFNIIEIVQFI